MGRKLEKIKINVKYPLKLKKKVYFSELPRKWAISRLSKQKPVKPLPQGENFFKEETKIRNSFSLILPQIK